MSLLECKDTVVTGAASGIGTASAPRFVEEGAAVVGCDPNESLEWDRTAAAAKLCQSRERGEACRSSEFTVGESRSFLWVFWFVTIVAFVTGPVQPTFADRDDHRSPGRCGGILEEITITSDDQSETVVTLDEIVPKDLQGLISTDRKSLTGVWISDIDLWTNANALACELPMAGDCPAGALEGACPDLPPAESMFSCDSPSTWVNNTFSIYELTTGSLYALNLWRVWSQQEYPTVASLRAAKPPVIYSGVSFENGLRNLDNRISMNTSLGEIDTIGTGAGAQIVLPNAVSTEGRIYESNVGTVIISESQTEAAVSLIYTPTAPKQALWRINLRRVRKCVDSTSFEKQIFPPRRKIKIGKQD
ncbi:MAG: hypothetical protein VCE43_06765 [Myxococcota bacterium]